MNSQEACPATALPQMFAAEHECDGKDLIGAKRILANTSKAKLPATVREAIALIISWSELRDEKLLEPKSWVGHVKDLS